MSKVFDQYADYYDLVYQDKDYERECDFIESLWQKYGEKPVRSVLNVGCGTGGHDIPLALKGYEIHGMDLSPKMIELATEKARDRGVDVLFTNQDISCFKAPKRYDAVISMFATMGYLTTNESLLEAFRSIRCCLEKGALFTSEVWYGPAVLTQRPESRVKTVYLAGQRIYRIADPVLESVNNVVRVDYVILHPYLNKEFKESHRMRYFFIPELALIARQGGFELVKALQVLSADEAPSLSSWNIVCIFRAC